MDAPEPSEDDAFDKSELLSPARNEFPCVFFAVSGDGGIVTPSGKIGGQTVSRKIQPGYGAAFTVGAIFRDFVGVSFECQYVKEKMVIDRTFAGVPMRDTFSLDSLNFMGGYFGTWKILYAEIGYYRGIGVFQWEKKTACNGVRTTEPIGSRARRDVNGVYYGAGICAPLSGDFFLRFGIRAEQPVTPAIVDTDRIRPDLYTARVGLEYHIPI